MASFSLPGRSDSILNGGAAPRDSKGLQRGRLEAAQAVDVTKGGSDASGASSATRGPKAAREATLAWRRTTAAATGLVDLADAAMRPQDGDRLRAGGPHSGVRSSSSSLSPSEDSSSSFFKTRLAGDGSDVGTSRSHSTSVTSLGIHNQDRRGPKHLSKHASLPPKSNPGPLAGDISPPNSTSSSLLQNGSLNSAEEKSDDSSQSREPSGDLRGRKVLQEPGFVSSPVPMSRNSARPQRPTHGTHNGRGAPGSAFGMDGVPSDEPANTLGAMREASRSVPLRGHDGKSFHPTSPHQAATAVGRRSGLSSTAVDRTTAGPGATSHRTAPSESSGTRSGAPKVLSSSPVTIGGKKRYPCAFPECDKTFSTSGHAARHHRIHSGRKPYRCTFPGCNASFSRQDNSLQHYRTHVLHPKGRSAAAVASSIEGDAGDSDLRALDLDPETEASVQLGRKALQEGTAIAIVQEYVGRDGRREEAVQRTVGMPRTRRDSVRSDQDSSLTMMDVDQGEPSELPPTGHAMQQSRSGSALFNGSAYSPPAEYYQDSRHATRQPHRLSMPQLPHLPPVAGNLFAPSSSPSPAFYPAVSHHRHPDGNIGANWTHSPGTALPAAHHPYGAPPAPVAYASAASPRSALSPVKTAWSSEGEAVRMGQRSADAVAGSQWRESSLNLLPPSRSREPTSDSPTNSQFGHHHRKQSSISSNTSLDASASQPYDRSRDRAFTSTASTAPLLLKSISNQGALVNAAAAPMLPSLSRSSRLSSPPTMPASLPGLNDSARKHSDQRRTMHLECPLPSLAQMPCSSDRSTSGLTPGASMEAPHSVGSLGAASSTTEPLRLPPLRTRLG